MPDALVSTDWLASISDAPDVRVVDATWFLPRRRARRPGRVRGRAYTGRRVLRPRRGRASPRTCIRTWCPRRPSSARGCASWAWATATGSWSTTATASSPRPGCGGCSASWATTTSWCWTAGWRSGGPRAGRLTDLPTRPQERHFTVRQNNLLLPRARPDARQPDRQARAGGRRALGRPVPRPRARAAARACARATSRARGTCTMPSWSPTDGTLKPAAELRHAVRRGRASTSPGRS